MTLLALRVLSQRSVDAIGHLLPVAALGGGLWLWRNAMPDPTPQQLAGLTLYALFALVMIFLRRK